MLGTEVITAAVGGVLDIVKAKVGDPIKEKEIEVEALKITKNAEIELEKVTQARLEAVKAMLNHKSIFVSGAIPAFLWVVPISVVFNCWIMPVLNYFGPRVMVDFVPVSPVWLPASYLTVVCIIISGLFGKKVIDGNAWFGKDGTLISPPKQVVESLVIQAAEKGENVEERFNKLVVKYGANQEVKK